MSRRLSASLITLSLVLTASAAWSYYRLAGAGETMIEAATKFIGTLTTDQRAQAVLSYNDNRRTDWHFIPKPDGAREGIKVRDLKEEQRQAAHAMLKAALSESGYGKATQIMALE